MLNIKIKATCRESVWRIVEGAAIEVKSWQNDNDIDSFWGGTSSKATASKVLNKNIIYNANKFHLKIVFPEKFFFFNFVKKTQQTTATTR